MRIVPWIAPLYADREAGGRALAGALAGADPVVVGVARGGVAVAAAAAWGLGAPLTAVDVERVNANGLRVGAVTAGGRRTCARRAACRTRRSRRRSRGPGAKPRRSRRGSSSRACPSPAGRP